MKQGYLDQEHKTGRLELNANKTTRISERGNYLAQLETYTRKDKNLPQVPGTEISELSSTKTENQKDKHGSNFKSFGGKKIKEPYTW